MKKLISCLLVVLAFALHAQERMKVTYSSQVKQDLSDKLEDNQEMKKAFLEMMERITYYELTLVNDQSYFKKVEKIRNDQDEESDGNSLRISISPSGSHVYKDLTQGIQVQKRAHMSMDAMVLDSLPKYEWQISREKDKILNFEVRKAIFEDEKKTIIAWYTPQINVKHGPFEFYGLPGLILKIEEQNKFGKRNTKFTTIATDVEVLSEDVTIDFPNLNKTMSAKEFDEKAQKMRDNMEAMFEKGVDTSD